jgi:hypothetical protein
MKIPKQLMKIPEDAKLFKIQEAIYLLMNCPHFDKKFIHPISGNIHESRWTAVFAIKINDNQEIHLVQKNNSTNFAMLLLEKGHGRIVYLSDAKFNEMFAVDYY